jgi:Tol biopolymer transport system component/DNA-binding winged helix-turn-helix (wHTH) protein
VNSESLTPAGHDTVYVFEGYCLEPARRSLTSPDGAGVPLNCKPFDVLVYLLQHAGEVVDRAEVLRAVWPRRVVEDNNVTQTIATLRRVLGARHIATVPGRGYQFVTPVTRMASLEASVEAADDPARADIPVPEQAATPAQTPPARPRQFPARWAGIAVLGLAGALLIGQLQQAEPEAALGAIAAMTPLTTYAGEEATPDFSPDGTQVVFSWDGGAGNEDLYVTQIGTRAVARLTTSSIGADRYPAWSPNGQHIAFLRQLDATRFDVVVIPSIGGGQERKLFSGELDWISREGFPLLAWTPDSAEVWVTTRHGSRADETHYGLHRVSLATGAVEPIALGGASGDYDTSPAVSPDGRWLAFTRFRSGERLNQVMVQPLGPGFVPVGEAKAVAEAALHHSLGWAPHSDRLWFVEAGRICEWRVGGTARIAVTAAQPSLDAVTFTHDGRSARAAVVTRRTDTDILALPLDAVSHAALGPPVARFHSTATDYHPRFSPDGKQLAFVSGRSGHRAIWIADNGSDALRQLTELTELITGFPRWSPDGKRLAFHTSAPNEERVIYTIAVGGGAPKRLGNACCPGGWAADGKHVYVHDSGVINRVMHLNVEDGSTAVLFEGEMAVESADGHYLLYAKSRERGYFRRSLTTSPGESKEERLVSDYVPASGGLAAVADGFFYVGFTENDRPRALRFYDYALGEARDIWPTPPNVAIGLTVSPDGRELLFAADSAEPNADLALLEFTPP